MMYEEGTCCFIRDRSLIAGCGSGGGVQQNAKIAGPKRYSLPLETGINFSYMPTPSLWLKFKYLTLKLPFL